MKKLGLLLMLLLAMTMQSHHVFAQSVTITLMPGWNWISVPLMDTLDFETALGSFTPVAGDIIKSQWGNASYRADGQWRGSISQFYPGYGYMYKSNRVMPVMVTFTTQQPVPQVIVTTAEPTDITTNSATCSGNVASSNGDYVSVTLRGICWSTNPNPTFNDNYIEAGNGLGSFTASMTELTIGTTYYVRAFAVTPTGTFYGEEQNFITLSGGGVIGGHDYVDLGLPSGILWAAYNVGADMPEDYGDYFSWGETTTKGSYYWSTYQYCSGNYNTLTKYCNNSSFGYNGFIDNLTTLLPEDDAATANWGNDWRMPTKQEWEELYNNTTCTWITQNGVNGWLFTASNGTSLFLPAAGWRFYYSLNYTGSCGYYWSSSLYTDTPSRAWHFHLDSGNYSVVSDFTRDSGFPVRPVSSSGQNSTPTGAINGKFTINADGDQVYFSQGNLQYQASTNTWKFAENQYDYVGNDNSNISSTYSGWIDLFGWGTSGYNHGANCYQPWSTSQTYSDYYAYGSAAYNLYDQTGKADWGYNPISNGGNTANLWRTLTQPEWNYVLNTRYTTSGIRYAKANVNNVNGIILLPDDWTSSTYSLTYTNSSGASFSSNTLTASQWSTLEQAGAVFLPAAGGRNASVYEVGSWGLYWSASYFSSSYAYRVHFGGSNLGTNGEYRRNGHSVRLVRVAEN